MSKIRTATELHSIIKNAIENEIATAADIQTMVNISSSIAEDNLNDKIRNRNFKMNNLADARDVEKLQEKLSSIELRMPISEVSTTPIPVASQHTLERLEKRVKELESSVIYARDLQMTEYYNQD